MELDRVARELQGGDRDAFRRFVSVQSTVLLARARSLVVDSETAHEVVQRALVRLWKRHSRLPDNWGALCGYSLKVVTNLGLDTIRDNALRSRREAEAVSHTGREDGIDHDSDPSWAIMAREAWELVLALPEPLRDVLLLRYGEGKTIQESADELGTSCETVSVRQRKALSILRQKLEVEVEASVASAAPAMLAILASAGGLGALLDPPAAAASVTPAAAEALSQSVMQAVGQSALAPAAGAGAPMLSMPSLPLLPTAIVLAVIAAIGVLGMVLIDPPARGPGPAPVAVVNSPNTSVPDPASLSPGNSSSTNDPPPDNAVSGNGTDLPPPIEPHEPHEPDPPPAENRCSITGQVVDTRGNPLADVAVAAWQTDTAVHPRQLTEARTNADGRFVFAALWSGVSYTLDVQPQADFLGQRVMVPPLPPDTQYDGPETRLVLARPSRITGVVRAPDGQPAAWPCAKPRRSARCASGCPWHPLWTSNWSTTTAIRWPVRESDCSLVGTRKPHWNTAASGLPMRSATPPRDPTAWPAWPTWAATRSRCGCMPTAANRARFASGWAPTPPRDGATGWIAAG